MRNFSTRCGEDKRAAKALRPIAAFVLSLALLAGCAATPEASRERDADAKLFASAPRAAIIYLYRADTPSTGGTATLWMDGRLIGQTVQATYFRVLARPGHNNISASGNDSGRIEIDTVEGGVYFIAMQVLGDAEGSSRTVFRSVPPETGEAQIKRCCTLLETWQPGQNRLPL
jgi:hypothetical protein